MTYAEWFSEQNESYQKEWLGAELFNMYKNGQYKPSKFYDPINKRYSLDDLERCDNESIENIFNGSD